MRAEGSTRPQPVTSNRRRGKPITAGIGAALDHEQVVHIWCWYLALGERARRIRDRVRTDPVEPH